jgi:hypothetical protein
LVLSIRGSANIDDIATDLACSTCEFLHGYAHEGMALAVQAVWEEAAAEVQTLAGRCFFLGGRKGRRLMEFVGMVIKGDAM